ncbi:MAG: DNA polymerase II [Deltaproteobacteria bacterium]|nr:DNA polymerase II [Deltaproteobacteria bacterium]
MPEVQHTDAFLLSREWRDADDGIEIVLWARAKSGPVRARLSRQEAVMFVQRSAQTADGRRAPRPLMTLHGEPVDAVYFRSRRALQAERDRLRAADRVAFESDVKPSDRFLMERFVTGALHLEGYARERRGILHFENPKVTRAEADVELSLLSLDIETEDLGGPILSVALATKDREHVFVRGDAMDERQLLVKAFAEICAIDPDVICGWNVTEFDLTVLEARARAHRLAFAIGRGGERARVLAGSSPGRASIARVPGRVVLDGITTLKSATYSFERFHLDYVAHELLGRGKKIAATSDPVREILRMHREDPEALAAYNLEDCRLVLDIFAKTDLLGFAMERARLTGLPMDRGGGSVAAFDHLYLPRLHRKGVVAPDVGVEVDVVPSPGGHVLESTPGLYRDVLSFDFRSLYPSIIRTFRIDPLGLFQPGPDPVEGEEGATFARDGAILPELIDALHERRSAAMATGNAALSRAIKILMNSFYGVLGTPGCRFFDSRLPTSITRRGHRIIDRARAFFEERDLPVIYGDTDSLFVHVREGGAEGELAERGRALATALTKALAEEIAREHRLESFLELRFESHYLRFLMPTTRGSDRGSKKRYAGLVKKAGGEAQVVVRGLEAVRRDWTPLARRVQLELLRRVFSGEAFEEWLREVAEGVVAGRYPSEDLVVWRADAEKEAAAPVVDPHAYLEKQLAAVCDVVLPFLGTSFERVAGTQTSLF